jgi:hypothetical protein
VRERDRVPVQEEALLGHGLASSLGRNGAPWPFSYFLFFSSFSFSVFLFLLYYLQKMLQINSNHFQKFSKNQCNDLTLQEN